MSRRWICLLLSLGTTRQNQNPTSVCLLGTCSNHSCQSHILYRLPENPLCKADSGPGRKRKPHLSCRTSFWSWEEPEISSTGSLADIPTYLRHWQWHSWHGKKHHSWCLPEPQVQTTQFVTSLIYFSVYHWNKRCWTMRNIVVSDDEQHKYIWAYILLENYCCTCLLFADWLL